MFKHKEGANYSLFSRKLQQPQKYKSSKYDWEELLKNRSQSKKQEAESAAEKWFQERIQARSVVNQSPATTEISELPKICKESMPLVPRLPNLPSNNRLQSVWNWRVFLPPLDSPNKDLWPPEVFPEWHDPAIVFREFQTCIV